MFHNLLKKFRGFLIEPLLVNHGDEAAKSPDSVSQKHLALWYASRVKDGLALPGISEAGFKVHSQTDEDGILLYIFSVIGTTNRMAIELCAGNGIECNSANLVIHHGWHALLFDGKLSNIEEGLRYYRKCPKTYVFPPKFVHAWITKDNINDLISRAGFDGPVDLLTIDMDGVDYWILDAIHCADPRVVVVEYQDILGPDRSLTVPYQDDFDGFSNHTTGSMPDYGGASLMAFVKLLGSRGYRLVGTNTLGFNAFFIKNGLGDCEIPAIDPASCFSHAKVRWGIEHRFPKVAALPWIEV